MTAVNLKSLKRSEVKDILQGIDMIISDCDGVLWMVENSLKGVPETIKKLKENGKKIFYVTNNTESTRQGFSKASLALGYEVEPDEIICPSYLVATYLKSINFNRKVYLIGGNGIRQELDSIGIPHAGTGPDLMSPNIQTVVQKFVPDPEIGAVVVALDPHISYPKLMKAATYLSDPNVLFIATSMDTEIPVANQKFPGPGALVKCIEACSGRKPVILGKPELYMKQAVIDACNIIPERTLFVGDNVHTDILLGKRCGMKTLLVLSGVTTDEDRKALENSTAPEMRELIPDFYIDSLADLHSYL